MSDLRRNRSFHRSTDDAQIATLLDSDAVDLSGISDAIRAQPELKHLVLAMTESLALAPGLVPGNVEEAAVVLGKNRLRVLVEAWSSIRDRGDIGFGNGCAEFGSRLSNKQSMVVSPDAAEKSRELPQGVEVEPEVLYLSSFFHWLGLDGDSANPAESRSSALGARTWSNDSAGLADLLLRDLACLTPYLEPLPEAFREHNRFYELATTQKESAE